MNSYTVLHYPNNTASLASVNNAALIAIGVSSKAYIRSLYADVVVQSNEGVNILSFSHLDEPRGIDPHFFPLFSRATARKMLDAYATSQSRPVIHFLSVWSSEFIKRVINRLPGGAQIQMLIKRWKGRHIAPQLRFIDGADIIHCYSGDLAGSAPERLVRERQIPGLAAWQGSEIRMPSIESQTNPYYHLILDEDGISPFGDDGLSRIRQQKMYELGFEPLVTAGMRQYILPEYTGPIHQIFHPVSLDSEPAYPELNNLRPLIVHIPSKERVKGSLYVRRAIERIRPLADFEYIEATGIPRTEVLDLMRRCDIYIDQMILGDHGMASLEAMSYGKPVVCYLKPSVLELLPADIPIVNATIDDLSEKLLELIKDPQMRCDLGQASRAYVKKYHDPYKLAVRLDGIYRDVLSRKGHNAVA